jgi:hypothetical protein
MITIDDIRCKHSGHFFDSATLRMFKTQVLPEVYVGIGGIFFATSEQYPGEARHFKVRQYWPDTGGITTRVGYSKKIVRAADAKALAVTAAATAGD